MATISKLVQQPPLTDSDVSQHVTAQYERKRQALEDMPARGTPPPARQRRQHRPCAQGHPAQTVAKLKQLHEQVQAARHGRLHLRHGP